LIGNSIAFEDLKLFNNANIYQNGILSSFLETNGQTSISSFSKNENNSFTTNKTGKKVIIVNFESELLIFFF